MALTLMAFTAHWRRHKIQALTLLIGLASATALWSGVQAINAHARSSYAEAAAQVQLGEQAHYTMRSGGMVPPEALQGLRRAGHKVIPVIRGRLRVGEVSLTVTGLDPVMAIATPAARTLGHVNTSNSNAAQDPGGTDPLSRFLRPPGEIHIAPRHVAALKDVLQQRFSDASARPAIIADASLSENDALTSIPLARVLVAQKPGYSSLLAFGDPQPLPAPWRQQLIRQTPPPPPDPAALTASFHLNLTAFALLAFLVGLLIVYASVGLAFEQRIATLRTLRALGVSKRMVIGAMVLELGLIALIAGALGMVLGYLVAAALLPDVAATLSGLYGTRVPGALNLSADWWASGLGISLLGALLASAVSLAKAARLPALSTTQTAAWRGTLTQSLRWQAIIGLMLLMVSTALAFWGNGLVAAFMVMGGLLLGTALLLPPFINMVLGLLARRAKGPVTLWLWQDARAELSGLSLALMALLVALAANVGVASMVEGFRLTFEDFLDERLAAELYIEARTGTDAEAVAHALRARADVNAVLPTITTRASVGGQSTEITGFVDHATFRDTWTLLAATPQVWDEAAQGSAVLISEQLARRMDVGVGDPITVNAPAGPLHLPVSGVFADYGNIQGQVRVDMSLMARFFPHEPMRRFLVRTANPGEVMALLAADFGFTEGMMIDQTGLKTLSRTIFARTFSVTGALRALTLLVAGFSLWAAMMTLANSRLPQLAPVWAMGLTRRHIALMEAARIVALAAITATFAVPLGIAVTWVLVALVQVEAFGWRLPLHIFPDQWLGLLLTALAVALLAALWPAFKLARTPPARLLSVFAHER